MSSNLSIVDDVLMSSHTMALCKGFPVFLSHTIVVSLWFVTPTAIISYIIYKLHVAMLSENTYYSDYLNRETFAAL